MAEIWIAHNPILTKKNTITFTFNTKMRQPIEFENCIYINFKFNLQSINLVGVGVYIIVCFSKSLARKPSIVHI